MSELKARLLGQTMNEYGCDTKIYLKSEADKVIAELKSDYKEACDRLQTANLITNEQLAATRHQKYKRCLTMEKWCAAECVVNQDTYKRYSTHKSEFRIGHLRKWRKRWLELAEKFKEA